MHFMLTYCIYVVLCELYIRHRVCCPKPRSDGVLYGLSSRRDEQHTLGSSGRFVLASDGDSAEAAGSAWRFNLFLGFMGEPL